MPITRYHLRNAHGISDPALYISNVRDDPQALLQGLTAAGLTGVLRQLGDLAEFAAEIFHELHKDVTSMASRGQGLTLRVQQLEAGFPKIEKDFVSQINDAKLAYSVGIDWHPNLQSNCNFVTRGDMPKVILDSYEECRGPPRLFMLDKFDGAGAGACLKRYSDPSFFKTSSSFPKTVQLEYQKGKKVEKSEVLHRRNDETGATSVANINFKLFGIITEQGSHDTSRKKNMRFKIRPPNHLNENIEENDQQIFESYSPDRNSFYEFHDSVCGDQEHSVENRSNLCMNNEGTEYFSCYRRIRENDIDVEQKRILMGEPTAILHMDKMRLPALMTSGRDSFSKSNRSIEGSSATKLYPTLVMEAADADADDDADGSSDGYLSADISTDLESHSYMDALTTSGSEQETDNEGRTNPDFRYTSMDSPLSDKHAFQAEESNDLKDSMSKVPRSMPSEHPANLEYGTLKYFLPEENDRFVPVLEVDSSDVPISTAEAQSEVPKPNNVDLVLDKDPMENSPKDIEIDILSAKLDSSARFAGILNLQQKVDLEVSWAFSHGFEHSTTKMFTKDSGDELNSAPSQNYTEDTFSPPKLSLKTFGGMSTESWPPSSLPPIPGIALLMRKRSPDLSSEPDGDKSIIRSHPPADVATLASEAPPLPPLPPTEWLRGLQFVHSFIGMNKLNNLNTPNMLLPIEELVNQAPSSMNGSVGESFTPPQQMLEVEKVISHPDGPEFESIQPLLPTSFYSPNNGKDGYEHQVHATRTPYFDSTYAVAGLHAGEETTNGIRQPLTAINNASELHPTHSKDPSSNKGLLDQVQTMNLTAKDGLTDETTVESPSIPVAIPSEVDYEVSNLKLQSLDRPKDPSVEAIASHRKIKVLRASWIPNKAVTDPRTALLEQIRTKAFILKPAVMTKPATIKGPVTNLKFAAILEKASNIRQALAGSDEDDDDSWD